MALVAYDNSDSSSYEDDENENNLVETDTKKDHNIKVEVIPQSENESENYKSLFIQLPQPSSKKKVVLEEDDEFLHKKEPPAEGKSKSKITIPSLKDFKDVEVTTPNVKTRSSNGKKSGLLSILPQPRNSFVSTTRSLIPNVLAQKPQISTAKKREIPAKYLKSETKAATENVKTKILATENSDESDDDVHNDFFSMNKPVELPEDVAISIEEPVETSNKTPRSIESYFKTETDQMLEPDYVEPSASVENVPAQGSSNDILDEEAILKLCGARGKRKREEIQIVDVNQQQVLSEAREMLLKGLMDDMTKRQSASKKRGNEPTNQQRRKHQITYLAHQAKANEAELQNQWANNRMSKRQTQSKYGF